MSKKKKIALAVVAVVLVIAIVAAVVVKIDRNKTFSVEEKSNIAMGTVVTYKIYDDKTTNLIPALNTLTDNLEKTISWRIEGSPVYNLNENSKCGNEVVAEVVKRCRSISALSGGAFDLSIGSVSRLWNFESENNQLPDKNAISNALKSVDYNKISVSGEVVTADSGMKLDLGSIGKGLACDFIKYYLKEAGVKGAVVSVGGSICVFGSRNKAGDSWRIAIKHPREDDKFLGVINLKEGFVSTSGDYEQFFEKDGKRYHHILDARTGYPAESGLQSVTVVCSSGIISDALSTACFILGIEESKELLERYDASAVFVDAGGKITTLGEVDFEQAK